MNERYYARSASDNTNDWPVWFVADRNRGGLNVTAEIVRELIDETHTGGVLTNEIDARFLAEIANEADLA